MEGALRTNTSLSTEVDLAFKKHFW